MNLKLPIPVTRALRKLGHDIRDARRRRRIPVAILAERASISRMTLNKVEKGDPGVSRRNIRDRSLCAWEWWIDWPMWPTRGTTPSGGA